CARDRGQFLEWFKSRFDVW
nr:immunoglobulin heavy chain junction region [Macaca mulatta]